MKETAEIIRELRVQTERVDQAIHDVTEAVKDIRPPGEPK